MNIVQIYPGKVWGGAEQLILDLGTALEARGHKIVYLRRHDSSAVASHAPEAVAVDFGWPFSLSAPARLARAIDDAEADVVHIHDLAFISVAAKAKKLTRKEFKLVFTRHIARRESAGFWRRKQCREVDAWVFVSELARNMFLARNAWIPENRCHVALNSVPEPPVLSEADKDALRGRLGIKPGETVMMFCGRVRKSKGLDVIVKALAEASEPRFRLVVVGAFRSERYRRHFFELAGKAGIADRITATGFVENPRAYEAVAHIGLAPSIVRESCGLAPMEFMAAGVPPIATTNGAQKEFIDDGRTGLLVEPGDAASLRDAINRLLSDPDLRQRMGREAARCYQDRLSYPVFVDRMTDIYNSALYPPLFS